MTVTMKDVFEFLSGLRRNNNKVWFDAHKAEYLQLKAYFAGFVEEMIDEISMFDKDIKNSNLAVSDCTYRIYRDLRFSPDKRPYKTHFGCYICKGGKKSPYSGYYLHIEPPAKGETNAFGGESVCMICAGSYNPEPKIIKSLREEIYVNGGTFVNALKQAKGFTLSTETSYKRIPHGYEDIKPEWTELIKLRDFSVYKTITPDYICKPNLAKRVAAEFKKTAKYIEVTNKAVSFAIEES